MPTPVSPPVSVRTPTPRHRWEPVCPAPRGLVAPVRLDPSGIAGPTRGQSRGPAWRRTSHGFFVPATVDGSVPEQRILEQAARLPAGGAVTGWAGCRLAGAAFLDGLGPDGRTRLPVPLATGGRNIRGDPAVDLLRDPLDAGEVVVRYGMPCARVSRSLFDAMRRARDVREAVVAMDMVAAAELVSVRRMTAYAATRPRWRGLPRVVSALGLASDESRSPGETRMRLIWLLDAGLPPPLVNRPVFDRGGRLLGVPDLLDVEAGLVGEYDGADHRGAVRHSADVGREDRLRRHGLEVFRVTGPDLGRPQRVVGRIMGARARATWQRPEDRSWTTVPPPGWAVTWSLDQRLDRDAMRSLHAG